MKFGRTFALSAGLRIAGLFLGAIGQALAARKLGPEAFGMSGFVQSMVLFGVILIDLGQAPANIREYLNRDSASDLRRLVGGVMLLRLVLTIVLSISTASALVIAGLPSEWILPVGWGYVILLTSCNRGTWLLQAQERHTMTYVAIFLRQSLFALGAFLWLKPGMPAGSDLVVQGIGTAAAFSIEWIAAFRGGVLPKFEWAAMREAIQHAISAHWLTLTTLVTAGFAWSELPMIRWRIDDTATGLYRTAVTIGMAVSALIALSAAMIYPRLVKVAKTGLDPLRREVRKVCLKGAAAGGALVIVAYPSLVIGYPLVFGAEYSAAIWPCFLVLCGKAVCMAGMAFITALRAVHKDRQCFMAALAASVSSLGLNYLLLPKYGIIAAGWVYLWSEFLAMAILCGLWRLFVSHSGNTAQESSK